MGNNFIKYRKEMLICILCCSILFVACSKKNNDSNADNNKIQFETNAKKIMDSISNHKINILDSEYYSYMVYDNHITDFIDFNYDVSDYGLVDSVIFRNNKGLYLFLENKDYCAIKDFNDSEINIYNISEKEKCHKFYIIGNEMHLNIYSYNMETTDEYKIGTISDGYISLLAIANLVDSKVVKYKWYRNNEEIPNSNVKTYTITSDFEDADYYVEIIAPNGDSYKSEPVNIKIDRR